MRHTKICTEDRLIAVFKLQRNVCIVLLFILYLIRFMNCLRKSYARENELIRLYQWIKKISFCVCIKT